MIAHEDRLLRQYVTVISRILHIDPPKIRYRLPPGMSPTTLAAASSDGEEICVKNQPPSADLYFSIAHELRHIWQLRTDPEKYMTGYKTRADLDVEAYNLQPAEIDANAFAEIISVNPIGVRPLFIGLAADFLFFFFMFAPVQFSTVFQRRRRNPRTVLRNQHKSEAFFPSPHKGTTDNSHSRMVCRQT